MNSSSSYPLYSGGAGGASGACDAGADPWVEALFHDCIYDLKDAISFGLGLLALCMWVVAQLPQFISNARNESADALSILFITHWLLGDSCNLVGCLLQGEQLPTTTFLAGYFVLADVVMFGQYYYYDHVQRQRRLKLLGELEAEEERDPAALCSDLLLHMESAAGKDHREALSRQASLQHSLFNGEAGILRVPAAADHRPRRARTSMPGWVPHVSLSRPVSSGDMCSLDADALPLARYGAAVHPYLLPGGASRAQRRSSRTSLPGWIPHIGLSQRPSVEQTSLPAAVQHLLGSNTGGAGGTGPTQRQGGRAPRASLPSGGMAAAVGYVLTRQRSMGQDSGTASTAQAVQHRTSGEAARALRQPRASVPSGGLYGTSPASSSEQYLIPGAHTHYGGVSGAGWGPQQHYHPHYRSGASPPAGVLPGPHLHLHHHYSTVGGASPPHDGGSGGGSVWGTSAAGSSPGGAGGGGVLSGSLGSHAGGETVGLGVVGGSPGRGGFYHHGSVFGRLSRQGSLTVNDLEPVQEAGQEQEEERAGGETGGEGAAAAGQRAGQMHDGGDVRNRSRSRSRDREQEAGSGGGATGRGGRGGGGGAGGGRPPRPPGGGGSGSPGSRSRAALTAAAAAAGSALTLLVWASVSLTHSAHPTLATLVTSRHGTNANNSVVPLAAAQLLVAAASPFPPPPRLPSVAHTRASAPLAAANVSAAAPAWLVLPGCGSGAADANGLRGILPLTAPWWCDTAWLQKTIGLCLGYAAMLIHIGSRFPQILHTWSRRSSEGLSASMFLLAVSANLCTGVSILLRVSTREALLARLPWLANALGTVGLDSFIIYLTLKFQKGPGGGEAEEGAEGTDTQGEGDASEGRVGEGEASDEGLRHPLLKGPSDGEGEV